MPTVRLDDRAVLSVTGPDAEHLLQNILTTDLDRLAPGSAKPGALLTPQGKILFDFLISRSGENGFELECRQEIADDFLRRLMLYRLRAKAEIVQSEQDVVTVSWVPDSDASPGVAGTSTSDSIGSQTNSTALNSGRGLLDLRFPAELDVRRHRGVAPAANSGMDVWTALRIAHGVAESGSDYDLSDAFPHDVLLDRKDGVGFTKGCYVGQEVVSRMQHRGTARRRPLIAEAGWPLPDSGTAITIEGRPVGRLGSVAAYSGLAIVRIDKVKTAIDAGTEIVAGDTVVSLRIPPAAGFDFPEDKSAGEEG